MRKDVNREYEKQFRPGAGDPKLRREVDRINQIVARMIKAGVPKRDINFFRNAYYRQGQVWQNMTHATEELDRTFKIGQVQKN